MISRFRLAGLSVMAGIALVGAIFYAMVSSHFIGAIIGQTLGPYSDTLAEHGFTSPDPEIWQRMAARHDLTILVEPVGEPPVAFDEQGERLAPATLADAPVRAVRTAEDGTRVTLYWKLGMLEGSHYPLMSGLLVMIVAVVGSAFWFLQRQLKPLTWLHAGVDRVAQGDFEVRVPVVRDDEIGQVAEAFNVMAGRVGEMIDDRERLLADVSHELRSPIGRMKVALEFMPQGDKREALACDLREMENLIAALLEREELRKRNGLEKHAVDVEAIAREVVAAFGGRAPGVELVSDGPVSIEADPALLKLLLRNLVDNAIKFSRPESAPVVVRLEGVPDPLVLRVLDDGIGIPAGTEEQIFEPFVKLDRARGHRVGYGIGLNLCRRIVELHGGTIRLLPREPHGTEAVVTIRRQPPDA